MNILFSFVLFTVAVTAAFADDWNNYKKNHGKNYSQAEEKVRIANFLQTDAMIKKHNNENKHYQMEHNKFSDMTATERSDYLGVKLAPAVRDMEKTELPIAAFRAIPASLDLRTDVCMSPIRNQGSCGSCWAFAAIEPLEFSHCKAHGNVKVDLSEQQLVDCSTANKGCNGGWYTTAWSYLTAGSATEATYPYKALTSTCKVTSTTPLLAKVLVGGIYGYYRNSPTSMQTAIQTYGPLAVAIDVVSSFYNYKSGVYNDATCNKTGATVNHGVVVVGWGTDTTTKLPYWIVRNSWGTGWGLSGYILMRRGVNMCNIEYWPAAVKAV